MRITAVRFTLCGSALPEPIPLSCGRLTHRNFGIVEVECGGGLVGIGETSINFPPWCVHERRATIEDGLAPLLVGEDPRDIGRLWRKMVEATRPYTRMWAEGAIVQAISGIDIALWDIAGQDAGRSVADLLGGRVRDAVSCYAVGFNAEDPAAGAREMIRRGYGHAKMRIGFDDAADIAKARAMREAVGPGFGMMIDANQAYDLPRARRMLEALRPLDLFWLEEPVLSDDRDAYAALRREFPEVPLAWGENAYTVDAYAAMLDAGAASYVTPDPCRGGGLTGAVEMCRAASARGIRFSPHHYGSDVGFAAALHVAASQDGFEIMLRDEAPVPLRGEIVTEPFAVVRGQVGAPTGPGLGVGLDRAAVEAHRIRL